MDRPILISCPRCSRHHFAQEKRCPFCSEPASMKLAKAAMAAATPMVLAACHGTGKWCETRDNCGLDDSAEDSGASGITLSYCHDAGDAGATLTYGGDPAALSAGETVFKDSSYDGNVTCYLESETDFGGDGSCYIRGGDTSYDDGLGCSSL